MKLNRSDVLIIFIGLVLAVLGITIDNHGLSFSGGSLIGSFMFRLGYMWGSAE